MPNEELIIPAERILALSLDADGCMLHEEYLTAFKAETQCALALDMMPDHDTLIQRALQCGHKLFFDTLIKSIIKNNYQQVIVMIGSNRQSPGGDTHCSRVNKNGKFFPIFPHIAHILRERLAPHNILVNTDTILLSDIYQLLEPGTCYQHAIENNLAAEEHDFVYDPNKFNIVFAQMHYLHEKYPNATIDYELWDDNIKIITKLKNFFKQYSTTYKPTRINFSLYHYTETICDLTYKIEGPGNAISIWREFLYIIALAFGKDGIEEKIDLNIESLKETLPKIRSMDIMDIITDNTELIVTARNILARFKSKLTRTDMKLYTLCLVVVAKITRCILDPNSYPEFSEELHRDIESPSPN